jgi:predicted PurR-regulated permease PerM
MFVAIVRGIVAFGAEGLVIGPPALAVRVAMQDIWRQGTAAGASDAAPARGDSEEQRPQPLL